MKPFCRDTWVEVDLDAIRANVETFRRHLPRQTGIMAVVKADGYGHGAVQAGREALAGGADSLAVAMLDEALVLRKAGIEAPLLVLGYTPLDSLAEAVRWDIQLTAYHPEWVQSAHAQLAERKPASKPLEIHLKVDTGMGRIGTQSIPELLAMADRLNTSAVLRWKGIFTHFACADEEDTTHVQSQHDCFQEMLQALTAAGYELPQVHCCNSAAAIRFPEWGYDTIRLGISLYGLYPSPYLKERQDVSLVPALQLKTRISHVKRAAKPFTVSYGATYTASPGEVVASLPIGYADGFSRSLSNRGFALHNGRRVAIIGRVCMDQTMLRIDEGNASVGDEVILYGRQGEEEISLDEVAALLGTINYEIPCMLNYRIPRVYRKNREIVDYAHALAGKR